MQEATAADIYTDNVVPIQTLLMDAAEVPCMDSCIVGGGRVSDIRCSVLFKNKHKETKTG